MRSLLRGPSGPRFLVLPGTKTALRRVQSERSMERLTSAGSGTRTRHLQLQAPSVRNFRRYTPPPLPVHLQAAINNRLEE